MAKLKSKKTFRRHFRIYFKNNHPAYIIDEEGNMYVVKAEKRDLKGRFSLFEIELKNGVNVDFPFIKKTGRTQIHQFDERATITSSTNIKTKKKNNDKKKDTK